MLEEEELTVTSLIDHIRRTYEQRQALIQAMNTANTTDGIERVIRSDSALCTLKRVHFAFGGKPPASANDELVLPIQENPISLRETLSFVCVCSGDADSNSAALACKLWKVSVSVISLTSFSRLASSISMRSCLISCFKLCSRI